MKRLWNTFAALFLAAACGVAAGTTLAAPPGGNSGNRNRVGGSQFNAVRQATFKPHVSKQLGGANVVQPRVGGGLTHTSPITPTFPSGPFKPPKGPIVGPITTPTNPI